MEYTPPAPVPQPASPSSQGLAEEFASFAPAPRFPEPAPPVPVPVGVPEPAAPTRPAGRINNPFLQQDPSTRARRLARALVSDLVVYYPEKRQRGLAEGNLKELFAEEIRKSWEEYSEQVGEEIAKSTPYFVEALNEILAEGRSMFG